MRHINSWAGEVYEKEKGEQMSDIKYKKRIAAEVPRRGGGEQMTDECSWCMALGHDWDTFGDGESCEMCGEKKPEKESAK